MSGGKRSTDPDILRVGVQASARPEFSHARKGVDYREVAAYCERVERERSDLGAALVLTQRRLREVEADLLRHEKAEAELTRSVHLAKQAADAIVADARERAAELQEISRAQAAERLADGRSRLNVEADQLDSLRMAVAAEAANLAAIEEHLRGRVSRAAASLVEIVDAPGGLGPFSQSTATLLEFAELLQRTAASGKAARVRFDVQDGAAIVDVSALLPPSPSQRETSRTAGLTQVAAATAH